MLSLNSLIRGPSHICDLRYLQHLLVVDLHFVELVRVTAVDCVGRGAVELGRGVEVRRVGHCRVLVGGLRLVVVGREDFGEGISNLDASIEANTLVDRAIESHKEAWVLIVMLGNW